MDGRVRVAPVAASMVRAQAAAALARGPVQAGKVGLIPTAEVLGGLRRLIEHMGMPFVVDPVMRASSGGRLTQLRPAAYLELALPNVVLTPNALEAAWLTGR